MRSPVALLALGLGLTPGAAGTIVQFDGDSALAYVRAQVAFGPRVPNTDGHVRAGDWIESRLRATADSVEVHAFAHVTVQGDTLRLRNFIARFRPGITDRILFLAHWDTRPTAEGSAEVAHRRLPVPGANDGGSGTAILLGVADALRREPPNVGVDLVFVDGEDYGDFALDRDVLLGSRYFAATRDDYMPRFGVLFDLVGDRDLRIPKEWNSVHRAGNIVEQVWQIAARMGYDDVFLNRVGEAVTDDHLPLLDAGIPVIDIVHFPFPSYHHTTDDTVDKVSARALELVGNVALALVHGGPRN